MITFNKEPLNKSDTITISKQMRMLSKNEKSCTERKIIKPQKRSIQILYAQLLGYGNYHYSDDSLFTLSANILIGLLRMSKNTFMIC